MSNYNTWNPADKNAGVTLADSNTTAYLASGSGFRGVRGTAGKDHGKWYFEVIMTNCSKMSVGIATASATLADFVGKDAYGWGASQQGASGASSWKNHNNSFATFFCPPGAHYITDGDIVMVAVDIDAGKVWFGINGRWDYSSALEGDPATGYIPSFTDADISSAAAIFPMVALDSAGQITGKFGPPELFTYPLPTGFSGWGDIDLSLSSAIILGDALDHLSPDNIDPVGIVDVWRAQRQYEVDTGSEGFTVTGEVEGEKAIGLYMSTERSTLSDVIEADVDIIGVQQNPMSFTDSWHVTYTIQNEGARLRLPALRLHAEAHDSAIAEAALKLPSLKLWSDVRINELANATLRIPMLRVSGSIDVGIMADAHLILPMLKLQANAYANVDVNARLKLPMLKLTANAIDGAVGNASLTLPMLKLTASTLQSIEANATLVLPMLKLHGELTPAAYASMVMNIRNNALSLYQGYSFNSLARFNGVHLGATAAKIYNIATGTNDNGVDIDANIRLPFLDLDVKTSKRLRQVWLSFKASGDLVLTVVDPSGEQWEYNIETFEETEDGIRVKIGKGIRSKYLAIDIKNQDGCTFDLDLIRLNLDTLGGTK